MQEKLCNGAGMKSNRCGEQVSQCGGQPDCGPKRVPAWQRWLNVPEAAIELGVSEEVVRRMCNARPPKIEHKREGTRGRGKLGTILIDRAVIEAHNAKRTYRPELPKASIVPQRRSRVTVVNPFW